MSYLLTVFTPTFNRLHTLKRTYEWMCKQTCQDFIWLIIDDGSTDGTSDEVKKWMDNPLKGFELRYVWKENGGLHTGYNKAIELAQTELIVCIDSDDYMPNDAVESIINFWHIHRAPQYAGFIGLDCYPDDKPVGGNLPRISHTTITDLRYKYHYNGDTKLVMRTDLLKKYIPQPTYMGEKNFNPIYLLINLDYKHSFLLLNKNLCYVEYQNDGMSANIFKQYINSPNSFAALRIKLLSIPKTGWLYKIRQHLHLASSICLSKNFSWLRKSPHIILTALMLPLGCVLSEYIKIKEKQ